MYSSSRMKIGVPIICFQISNFLSLIRISASKFFIVVSMVVHVRIFYFFFLTNGSKMSISSIHHYRTEKSLSL